MGYYDDYLEHHGILGQKWGVRRFENKNGTLTPAGKNRYNSVDGKYQKLKKKATPSKVETTGEKKKEDTAEPEKKKGLTDKQKKMIIAGAAVVGTAVAAYGGYKLYQLNKQATEGLSNDYHKKATDAFVKSNKMHNEGFDLHTTAFDSVYRKNTGIAGMDEANKMMSKGVSLMNQAKDLRESAYKMQDKAKSKKYSIGEKVNYLKSQSSKNNSATNKLASEASALAKSVTAEGPKSFSKPAQNSAPKVAVSKTVKAPSSVNNQVSSLRWQAAQQATNRAVSVAGKQKFDQAAKADSDLVNELLKKNASILSKF